MRKVINIAVDGPSGAGKSTIARTLAACLGYTYLDTGAMYRAIALKADRMGLKPVESNELAALLSTTDIGFDSAGGRVLLDGKDVTAAIREHRMSKLASDFSALKAVRLKLVDMQRAIAARSDCILDGRDIGTFVLPNADYKFYLTATPEARAERRCLELKARGAVFSFDEVLGDIVERDYNDTHRDFAPLRKADDAIEIDSTALSISAVAEKMLAYMEENRA